MGEEWVMSSHWLASRSSSNRKNYRDNCSSTLAKIAKPGITTSHYQTN